MSLNPHFSFAFTSCPIFFHFNVALQPPATHHAHPRQGPLYSDYCTLYPNVAQLSNTRIHLNINFSVKHSLTALFKKHILHHFFSVLCFIFLHSIYHHLALHKLIFFHWFSVLTDFSVFTIYIYSKGVGYNFYSPHA